MKILFWDFSTKIGTEVILKTTIRKVSLHKISNENGTKVQDFDTSKNLICQEHNVPLP